MTTYQKHPQKHYKVQHKNFFIDRKGMVLHTLEFFKSCDLTFSSVTVLSVQILVTANLRSPRIPEVVVG